MERYPPLTPFPLPNSSGLAEPPCFFSASPLPNTEVTPHLNLPYLTGSFFGLESFPQNPCQFYPLPLRLPEWSDLYTKDVCLRRWFQSSYLLGLNTCPRNDPLSPLAKAHRTSNWKHRNAGPNYRTTPRLPKPPVPQTYP